MSGTFIEDRSCGALAWLSGIHSAGGPNHSGPKAINNEVNCLAGWFPLFFDVFRSVSPIVE
jgi:hypothetical protein